MSAKIIGIRWSSKRGVLQLTQVRQSPRGTRVLGKSLLVEELWKDKKERESKIEPAIVELLNP